VKNISIFGAQKFFNVENLLPVPLYHSPGIDIESQAVGFDRFIPPFRLTDSAAAGANGFMLVGGDGEYEGFSHHYRVN